MATYTELFALKNHSDLQDKVAVACIIAAETIQDEDVGVPNHDNRMIWAKAAFDNPIGTAKGMLWALLAANKAQAVGAITGAADATIQTAVDAAVNVFADGN